MHRSCIISLIFTITLPAAAFAGGFAPQTGGMTQETSSDSGLFEPTVLFVDASAPPGGNGVSWATAYADLQDAITDAELSGGAVTEIRVAGGVYVPSRGDDPNDPRSATFDLLFGVRLRGGYAGRRFPNLDSRDLHAHPSILSGDLAGDDEGGIDDPSRAENAYHVVSSINRTFDDDFRARTIDGFVITGGHADGAASDDEDAGGGLLTLATDTSMIDCSLIENWAYRGGGVAVLYASDAPDALFVRCLFDSNFAASAGGGLYCRLETQATLINSVIRNNLALEGGGIYCRESVPLTMQSCVIRDNEAVLNGGGIYWRDTIARLSNLTVVGNAAEFGGGLYAYARIYPDIDFLTSSILWSNDAMTGKQVALAADDVGPDDRLILEYCIIGGGVESIATTGPGDWRIESKGCLSENPSLLPALGSGGVRLAPTSPCIDAGDPHYVPQHGETDIDGDDRVIGGRIDIGADEFVPNALKRHVDPARLSAARQIVAE